jgi:transcriptional regulator with XRE-family HTH domain
MYTNLKLQIWRLGVRQNRLAQMIGIHETLLSKIINGFRQPDAKTRACIAAALHSDEDWLFTSNAGITGETTTNSGGSEPEHHQGAVPFGDT